MLGAPSRSIEPDETIRVMLQYLGVKDLKTLEKEWHDYVKGLQATTSRGYALAARLYLAYGLPIKARRFYEKAIEMGDNRPVVYAGLGKALAAKTEYEAAENAYKKALEGDPHVIERKTKDPRNPELARLRQLALEVDPDDMDVIRMISVDEALRKAFETPESKPAGP
jgi:tetratricopeptide (TPR) repeat protein